MDALKHVLRMRSKLPEVGGYPDTCTIKRPNVPTHNEDATLSFTTMDLGPFVCRVAPSRAFRAEKLMNQEINANEHVIHFPVDVAIYENDLITVVDELGRYSKFEPRRVMGVGHWQVTREVLATELENQSVAG